MKKQFALSLASGLLMLGVAAPAFAATISSQMDIGARGTDVTTLQQTLAADASLYPEGLVTGYFGSLSSAAVKRFQAKYGLVSSGSPATTGYGRVGPVTIQKFNQVYGGAVTTTGAPIISGVTLAANNNGMNVLWSTNQSATGVVYYSTSPLVVTEASGPGQAPVVNGTNVMTVTTASNTNNSTSLPNLTASTTYYYMIQVVAPSGVSVTWPATFRTN